MTEPKFVFVVNGGFLISQSLLITLIQITLILKSQTSEKNKVSLILKNSLQDIKYKLQLFYGYTGECDEFQITRDSEIGGELLSIGLKKRQGFLDNKDSGLQIIINELDSIVVKLNNVTC